MLPKGKIEELGIADNISSEVQLFGQQDKMSNKIDEEGDYLESLFLKPFCERYFEQPPPDKTSTRRNSHQKKSRNVYRLHNIPDSDEAIHRKSHNDRLDKHIVTQSEKQVKVTPYLSRKNQQKALATKIKKKIDGGKKEASIVLQTSQNEWLIIREMQASAKDATHENTPPRQMHKNRLSDARLSRTNIPEHSRKNSEKETRRPSEQECPERSKQESKNIKTMMSYYKNKRAIKQMSKLCDSFNLTNSIIEQSINLRVEAKSNHKPPAQQLSDKLRVFNAPQRKMYIRQRTVKTQSFNPFADKIKVNNVKSMHLKDYFMHSKQLKGILSTFKMKIDLTWKQRRPKTETHPRRSEPSSTSKNAIVSYKSRCNQVSGWQNTDQSLYNLPFT